MGKYLILFNPPHVCKPPTPKQMKEDGAGEGARWQCECNNIWVFKKWSNYAGNGEDWHLYK